MKKAVRTVALLLCITALFAFASCGSKDTTLPKGMMIASCAEADYRLFVPTTWNLNTMYGVSGANRDLNHQSTVSVNRYACTDELTGAMQADGVGDEPAERLDWFLETQCLPSVRGQALNRELATAEEAIPAVLGGVNARRYHFSGIVNGETLHFVYVIAERSGAFYVFCLTVTDDLYEMCVSDTDKMLDEFLFADPYVPEDYARKIVSDGNAPGGMKPAYSNDVAYRFYVPADWVIDLDQGIYAGYAPDDRSSVSVVPYFPLTEGMTPDEYFTDSQNMMKKIAGEDGFTLIGREEATLGGVGGFCYDYTLRVGDTVYRYRQIVVSYKSMIYSMTYTSTEARFEAHLEEWNAMVSAFAFR